MRKRFYLTVWGVVDSEERIADRKEMLQEIERQEVQRKRIFEEISQILQEHKEEIPEIVLAKFNGIIVNGELSQ